MSPNLISILAEIFNKFSPLNRIDSSLISPSFLQIWQEYYNTSNQIFGDVILLYPSYFSKINDTYFNLNEEQIVFWTDKEKYPEDFNTILKHITQFSKENAKSISKYFVEKENQNEIHLRISYNNTYINNQLIFSHPQSESFFTTGVPAYHNELESNIFKVNLSDIYNTTLFSKLNVEVNVEDNNYSGLKESIILHLPLISQTKEIHYIFSTTKRIGTEGRVGYGGIFVLFNSPPNKELLDFFHLLSDIISLAVAFNLSQDDLSKQQLRTAIISILVDSYAHNISAHSLSTIESWLNERVQMLNRPIYINNNPQDIVFEPNMIPASSLKSYANQAETYYKYLNLDDHTNTNEFITLGDITRTIGWDTVKNTSVSPKVIAKGKQPDIKERDTDDRTKVITQIVDTIPYELPLPVDFHLAPLIRFLKGKGAFWSGVTRDLPFGGTHITIFSLLFDEIARNPLYMGTIASTEGVYKINIRIFIESENNQRHYDFVQINTEELIHKNSNEQVCNKSPKDLISDCFEFAKEKEEDSTLNYSPYSFMRFGQDFKKVYELLSTQKVFMPGGLVGIHAFLTIFENTIRNVKHYKTDIDSIKQNGLDLIFTFQNLDILNLKKEETVPHENGQYKGKHRLYRVGLGFGHAVDAINNEDLEKRKKEKQNFEKIIFGRYTNQILDETSGRPNLGGTSQDKICAAMLLNNRFAHVETVQTVRDHFCYPWIHPRLMAKGCVSEFTTFNPDYAQQTRDRVVQEALKGEHFTREYKVNEYKQKAHNTTNGDAGPFYFFKFFNIWKSDEIYELSVSETKRQNPIEHLYNSTQMENYSRFKFLVVDDFDNYFGKLQSGQIGRDVYRVIKKRTNTKMDGQSLYLEHNALMFAMDSMLQVFDIDGPENKKPLYKINISGQVEKRDKSTNGVTNELVFVHKSTQPISDLNTVLNFRSHGILNTTFLKVKNSIPDGINPTMIHEFLETIFINCVIIDNRINELFLKKTNKIPSKISDSLNIFVYSEEKEYGFGIEANTQDNHKENLIRPTNINHKNHTIYIIHLSYIESLRDNSSNEKMIDKFLEKNLGLKGAPSEYYNVSVCIVSGRGNDTWYNSDLSEKFRPFVLFRPIDSLMNVISDALVFEDDFQIKYNIIKTVLGC